MLYEYKIQKIQDGNGEEKFKIMSHKVSSKKWWQKKQWSDLDNQDHGRYGVKDSYNSLGEAQNVTRMQMESDAKDEYSQNRYKTKVLKEYTYTEIPNHIPEEQQEKFCDLSEVKA